MAAFGISHEIQVVRFGGIERSPQRRTARIGYRTGREPNMTVSIVGRIEGQVSRVQASIVASSQFERVDHGRVALQGDAMVKAINENARDYGPLFRLGGFSLH